MSIEQTIKECTVAMVALTDALGSKGGGAKTKAAGAITEKPAIQAASGGTTGITLKELSALVISVAALPGGRDTVIKILAKVKAGKAREVPKTKYGVVAKALAAALEKAQKAAAAAKAKKAAVAKAKKAKADLDDDLADLGDDDLGDDDLGDGDLGDDDPFGEDDDLGDDDDPFGEEV